MQKVLILGAGMVAKPIITYLLEKGYHITVASPNNEDAESMLGNHPNGVAVNWSMKKQEELDKMIKEHDLTVSLLPWVFHIIVAKKCITHKKNMVTTSYVKPEMKALHAKAKEAGIIILNEVGLDPGIDHMSAMRIIDHVHANDGKIEEFYSICGALPAPEAADNPFRYKFSWSPKGVILAGNNDGRYLRQEQVVDVATEDLFKKPLRVDFPNVGPLEVYPNRDSLPYIDLYGIPEAKTMMRGTFRHPGWCESMDAMKKINLLSCDALDLSGKTYAEMIAILIGEQNGENIREKTARFLDITTDAHSIKAMDWLGLFDSTPMNRQEETPFEVVSDRMIEKMMLGEHQRDMVAMQHVFLASFPDGKKELIKSSMLDFGTLATDTAVARTVALPAAVSVEMILNRDIQNTGVHIPVTPEIYNPILDKLEEMDIKMVEEFGLPVKETI